MSEKAKIQPRTLKGFRDFGFTEQSARQNILAKIQGAFESFGFAPMYTPALEYKDILMGKYGDDEKLIYSFTDNGEREVALRYDLTVPMARFVAQNLNNISLPFKRYQIAPVWRAENTQKGRSREFYQCDVDIVGTSSPLADAEVIACFCKAFEEIGVKDIEVKINDRRIFNIFLNKVEGDESKIVTIIRGIDKLDKIGADGVIEWLASQGIEDKALEQVKDFLEIKNSNNILAEIQNRYEDGAEIAKEVSTLFRNIMSLGVSADKLAFDPFTARGLDYYTSIVFEFVLKDNPEFGSVCGGGRYDGLVDLFSNQQLPAVGASIGLDRLFEALEARGVTQGTRTADAIIFNLTESLTNEYLALAKKLRSEGLKVEFYYEAVKLDKQFKYSEIKNIPFAILLGEEEKNSKIVKIKNLKERQEFSVPENELAEKLKNLVK